MRLLLIAFFFSNSFLFCQTKSFFFPEDLRIDPYSYGLKDLKIKKIEQIRLGNDNSNGLFQYIIEYDSLGRITKFKYDFREEGESIISPGEQITIIFFRNDSSYLERLITNNDTTFFNYYENSFVYEDNESADLKYMEVKRPYRSVIDGVVLNKGTVETVSYKRKYNDNNLLVKETVYFNDKLFLEEAYDYILIYSSGKEYYLLSSVKDGETIVLRYYFYD